MCGIAGIITDNEGRGQWVKKMCDEIAHRGPDGEGYLVTDGIALGHRRLSLIDLEGGAQPMTRSDMADGTMTESVPANGDTITEPCRWSIVFNGEIYNYRDLRKELEELGQTFTKNSDTEVLLAAYIQWGKDALIKLRGMFAFAIWDNEERKLFCARDYFGIKPFYWTRTKHGEFAFASESKALLTLDIDKVLNEEALAQYLTFQYSPLAETFFKGIYKLAPGHCMTVDEDCLPLVERWWYPTYMQDDEMTMEEATEKIADAIRESVSYHKIADVEVASFLSSGVDSNYLAASLAAQQTNIKTFTVGFDTDDGKYTEIDLAKKAADSLGVDNISHEITEEEFWETVPKVQWHMDEPSADPAAVALWFVDREAAKHVKAVLSGEGSDELFGGYTVYQTVLENEKLDDIPRPLLKAGSKVLNALHVRGGNYLYRASTPLEERFVGNANIFSLEERDELMKDSEDFATPYSVVAGTYATNHLLDPVTRMQDIDLHHWLVGDILLKTDKMAMAHSLESRVPFLDTGVWNVARTLPSSVKVSQETTKVALRKAAATVMDEEFTVKRKLGFPVPIRLWLKEDKWYEKVKETFTSEVAKHYFNTKPLLKLLDDHRSGKVDNCRKIWCVYSFLVWYEQYFGDYLPQE